MAEYPINKGIGRPVEFKGLRRNTCSSSQAGCLPPSSSLSSCTWQARANGSASGFGAVSASATVWLTFRLNAKYGEHGLMKLARHGCAPAMCSTADGCPIC